MKKLKINHIFFVLILYLIFLLIGLNIVFFTNQKELHIIINNTHHPIADFFFKYITFLGNGAVLLLLFPVLFLKYRLNIFYLGVLTYLYAGFLTQFFKKVIFFNIKRPNGVFEEGILRVIDGVHLYSYYSFPSGHTTSIVALCSFLSFLCKGNKINQFALFSLSILVAFSRVYISQHFFEDILGGVFLGVFSFILAYFTIKLINYGSYKKLG